MNAIDKIKRGLVIETSKWREADRVMLDAILELAERVEALEKENSQWMRDAIDNEILAGLSMRFEAKKTKPSIDWSHVSPEYKWLARDEDGLSYLYIEKPECGKSMWMVMVTKDCIEIKGFKSYKAGTCDWKDSLVERPEGV